MAEINEIREEHKSDEELIDTFKALDVSNYARLNDFITLSQNIRAKQDAIDIMAADSTPYAIGASYVADTLEPNSQGDLVTLVAKVSGEQIIIENIYRRLNIPFEKVVYSLFKNAMVIAEFAHEGDLAEDARGVKSKAANEAVEKEATEDIKVKVHNSKLIPKIRILSDTTRVFPILQYEDVVGFIEVTLDDWSSFNMADEVLSYKDVVIHSAEDYVYVKFGFRTESKPLQLKVKLEDGSIVEYDIDQGKSLLEAAYPAWQTLTILKDAINLARLAFSASSVIVQTEVGSMSEAQIELARNKLKDLFENRLAYGKNGAKSYLQPQIRPNYIYSFTKNGVGSITTSTVGGEYNPGALTDLKYFEDEFFGAMGAVKQHYARTSDSAGLDGGGAVEQYEKRYLSYVAQFKRLLAKFIKDCINRVLLSRNLTGIYDNFNVIVNKAYEEDDLQVVNLQQTKLTFLQGILDFLDITNEKTLRELKLQAIKTVVTDRSLLESLSAVILEGKTGSPGDAGGEDLEGEDFGGDLGMGNLGGGGGLSGTPDEILSEIDSVGTPDEDLGEDVSGETGLDEEETNLPEVAEVVSEDEIDQNE